MSTLALLVILLLVLVGLMVVSVLGYAAHRHPDLAQPIGVALAGAAVLAATVAAIVAVGT